MSSTGASSTPTAGEPKAQSKAETNKFSGLEDKDPVPSSDPLETRGASSYPLEKGETPSLPNPGEVAGRMVPGGADINDSIAKVLLDALQIKRTGNNLPPAAIPLARIRAAQLKQCLLTGRDPSDNTVQSILVLISLEQETPGPANLADNVPTTSHTL